MPIKPAAPSSPSKPSSVATPKSQTLAKAAPVSAPQSTFKAQSPGPVQLAAGGPAPSAVSASPATLALTAASGVGKDRPEMGLVKMHYNNTGLGSSQAGRELAFWSYATAQFVRAGLGQTADQANVAKLALTGEYIGIDQTGVMQALNPMYASPGKLILDNLGQNPGGTARKAVLTATASYIKDHPSASQQQVFDNAMVESRKLGGTTQEIRHRAILAVSTVNLLEKVGGLGGAVGLDAATERALTTWQRSHITLSPSGGTQELDRNHHYWVHALNTSDLIARRGVDPAKAAEAVRFMGVAYEIGTSGSTGLKENKANASLKDLQVNNAGVDFALGTGSPSDTGPANEVRF
ncbi:MAG: hypothetical protein ACYC8T_09425 [Myxococcaceae bacterium]